jgi:hypothetical protein
MHAALWTLSAISVLGAFVAAARPKHVSAQSTEEERRAGAEVQAAA